MSNYVEKQLHKSMKNKELIQLLDLEKSLVYITTALKANQIVLEKILRINIIKKYSEDEDLLEDVIIENKQAIEMAEQLRELDYRVLTIPERKEMANQDQSKYLRRLSREGNTFENGRDERRFSTLGELGIFDGPKGDASWIQ